MSVRTIPGRSRDTGGAAIGAPRHQVPGARAGGGSWGDDATVGSTAPGQVQEYLLVSGYLAAVVNQLDERGIGVRGMSAGEPGGRPLAGTISLHPAERRGQWTPYRVDWHQDSGWSAVLLPGPGPEDDADVPAAPGTSRYLSRQLVPDPSTVAHFVTALISDPDTIWARQSFDRPRRIDRRLLILQLGRFAMPEPW